MKGNKLMILGLGILLLGGIFSPLAAGENDSLHVIMTVEDRNYGVGDTINIQLRIYDKGVPTDLANVQGAYLGMSTHHSLSDPVNITLARQETGIYQGQYTVRSADHNRRLYFFYGVALGNDKEEGRATIQVHSIQDTVDVTIGGLKQVPAKPGDTLKATVLVRTGDTPIPITGFTDLYLEAPNGLMENRTYTERETGIYDVDIQVPAVSVSGTYKLVVRPIGFSTTDEASIHVNVLDVWCHKISSSGNSVSFEVCVADLEGLPVAGASFIINRNGWPHDSFTGVTDASGKYMLHVPDISGTASFSGYAIAGGLNQSISGTVFNHVAEQPHHSDFDIIWEGEQTIFKPNTQVIIPYGAYRARLPDSSKTIYYYVAASGTDFWGSGNHPGMPREVIASGSITPDAMGKFNIAFKTPKEQCAIEIRMEVPLDRAGFTNQTYDLDGMNLYDLDDESYYKAWPENTWNAQGFVFYAYEGRLDGDKGVSLKVGSFKPGKPGRVTVTTKAQLGDPIYVFWAVGETSLDKMDSYDPEWMRWVPGGNIILLQPNEKGKNQGEFLIPEFIEDQDITVAAGYVDSEGIPHFEVQTKSPGAGVWLWVGIIAIIAVIVIVIVIVARERGAF